MSKVQIQEGQVFISKKKERFRRIVGIVHERVIYSDGSNRNKDCNPTTFKRWVTNSKASVADKNVGSW